MIILTDFLNELRKEIPIHQNDDNKSFLDFIESYYNKICSKIEKIDSEQLEAIANSWGWNAEQLCLKFDYLTRMIVKTVRIMNDGKPASAYNFLKSKVLSIDLDNSGARYIDYFSSYGLINTNFYRIRKSDGNGKKFEVNDLYHIPFELRTEIKPQRFSILGYPSLYLGTSVYICWLEMGQPSISDVYVSRFKQNESVSLVDLCVLDEFTDLSIQGESQRAFRFLITFPLIAASLVKVKKTESPFKPEYIIPQLLLQFIRNDKMIDGIMFTSTKILDRNYNYDWRYRNVVIPVFSNKESGYCEKLRKKFIISKPIQIEESPIFSSKIEFFDSVEKILE